VKLHSFARRVGEQDEQADGQHNHPDREPDRPPLTCFASSLARGRVCWLRTYSILRLTFVPGPGSAIGRGCPGSRSDRGATAPVGAALDGLAGSGILGLARGSRVGDASMFTVDARGSVRVWRCHLPTGARIEGLDGMADRGWATMLTLVRGPLRVVVRSHDDDGELSPRLLLPPGGSAAVQTTQADPRHGSCRQEPG
jgi:hypothetical protein